MFAVVEFVGADEAESSNEIAIVPLIWLYKNDRRCYWPHRTGGVQFDDFVKNQTIYKKSWPSYKVFKLHFKTENYDKAEEKLASILKHNASESEMSGASKKSVSRKRCPDNDNKHTSESSDSEIDSQVRKKVHMSSKSASDEELLQSIRNPLTNPMNSGTSINKVLTAISEHVTPSTYRRLTPTEHVSSPVSNRINSRASSYTSHTSDDFSNIQQNTGDFQITVLNYLSKLTEHVDQHSIILNELVRTVRKNNEDSSNPPIGVDLPKFPISSLEEFQQFDSKLQENSSLSNYMVARLAAVGGSGIDSLTRRIMKYLMTNELAILYNWKGRDKLAFEKTQIMAVIYDAAKLNFPANERNDLVIANAVKDWLKYAKARENVKARSSFPSK